MFANLERTAREAGRNRLQRPSHVRLVDAVNMYNGLREKLVDYIAPPSGEWGWDWALGELKVLGWGASVVYVVRSRYESTGDFQLRELPLDGKAMDAVVARKRWRKALLWAKSALALQDLLALSLEPGHRGAKRVQADFEERSGKRVTKGADCAAP